MCDSIIKFQFYHRFYCSSYFYFLRFLYFIRISFKKKFLSSSAWLRMWYKLCSDRKISSWPIYHFNPVLDRLTPEVPKSRWKLYLQNLILIWQVVTSYSSRQLFFRSGLRSVANPNYRKFLLRAEKRFGARWNEMFHHKKKKKWNCL